MKCQRRTDTSMGCPAMHRRELKETLKGHRERLASIKPTIDTRPPVPQPHLTLYGRDYAAKKKATTEAAFADLKMIQAIARTMTRKHEIPERKGPVSLNSDSRKAEIYRVMNENHKLLDNIESVEPFCSVRDMLAEHKFKQRYVINASHTMRMSGEYDTEIARIRREDQYKLEMSQRSIELRREAAQRLAKSSGSVSLPSLTAVSTAEPAPAPGARQGAKRTVGPSQGWSGSMGDAEAAEERRGGAKQQAKPAKPREPAAAPPPRPAEPTAAVAAPRPAVRFLAGAEPQPGAASSSGAARDLEAEEDAARAARRAARKATPHPKVLVKVPDAPESEASDTCDQAQITAEELEKAAMTEAFLDEGIVVEDDCAPAPPAPPAAPPPRAARPEGLVKASAPPDGEYQEDFDEEPGREEPKAAAPHVEEPPPDAFGEPAPAPVPLPPRAPAGHAAPGADGAGGGVEEGVELEELLEHATSGPLALARQASSLPTSPAAGASPLVPGSPDAAAVAAFSASWLKEEKAAPQRQAEEDEEEEEEGLLERVSASRLRQQPSAGSAKGLLSPASAERDGAAAGESDEFEASAAEAATAAAAVALDEPDFEEPQVQPSEEEGVHSPVAGGLGPVGIARPAKQDARVEDQAQDEYEDAYEDDFVKESETLGREKAGHDDFEDSGAFGDEGAEEDEEEDEQDGGDV